MKRYKYILLMILCSFLLINNVYAYAGFDGAGKIANSSSGGAVAGTKSGFVFMISPMIKFTLVDISDSNKLKVLDSRYMINETGTYDDYLKNKNLEGAMKVRGYIDSNGIYSTEAVDVTDKFFPSDVKFEDVILQGIIENKRVIENGIIPNRNGVFLNFSVDYLKDKICNFDGSGKCNLTPEYEKIVIYMLKQLGINVSSLSNLPNDIKSVIVNYRILIEPIYALKYDGKYRFVTVKAIGALGKAHNSSGANPYFGVYIKQLFYNTYAELRHGSINSVGLKHCEETSPEAVKNCYKNLADANNGAGYAIFKLSYDIPNTCIIEKNANGEFLFTDKSSAKFSNNLDFSNGGIPGSNFAHLISKSQCGCDVINNSTYKSELLSNSILQNIYNTECTTPVNSCTYSNSGGNYIYYGKNGQNLTDYGAFVKNCGCTHDKVLELAASNNLLENIRSSECTPETVIPSGQLGVCTTSNEDNNVVSLTKIKQINEYCKRTCVEEIKIDNLINTSSLSYKAGQYFKFDRYPSLSATKSCALNFNYDAPTNDWFAKYKEALTSLTEAYKQWKYYASITVSSVPCNLCPPYNCPSSTPVYSYSYSYFTNSGEMTLTQAADSGGWSGSCGEAAEDYSDEAQQWENIYLQRATNVAALKSAMESCNSAIDFEGDNFYIFEKELEFHYQQDVLKNDSVHSVWNENRDVPDHTMTSSKTSETMNCSGTLNPTRTSCTFEKAHLYDDISNNSIEQNDSKILNSSSLTRSTTYSYSFIPSVKKYSSPLIGEIKKYDSSCPSGVNCLENVYDIDVNAVAKNGNNNHYVFTKLGENSGQANSLYEKVGRNNLTRTCTYNIYNDVVLCNGTVCDDSSLKVLYRVVDDNAIDPNNRLIDSVTGNIITYNGINGFKNWRNVKGKTVLETIQNSDTYNPGNLEYSFTLDSAAIKKIREYNSNCSGVSCEPIKYSSTDSLYSKLTCNNEGNECISSFIEELSKPNGYFGSEIAKVTNGSNSWRYLDYDNIKGYYVNVFEKNDITYSTLINRLKLGGEEVLP